jgi:hypothetical protein
MTRINELNYIVQEGRANLDNDTASDHLGNRLRVIKEKLSPMVQKLPAMIDMVYEGERVISLKVKNLDIDE